MYYILKILIRIEKFYLKKCKWDKINLILMNIKLKKGLFWLKMILFFFIYKYNYVMDRIGWIIFLREYGIN